ncbi:hypothetical protein F2Q70_00015492 [Brassica cretica]|uniref:Uncharacterized protein n=1 Tax=Brassica cretica TaxID=69181 RepID=A0A8S9I656_BRACR|nr:hypothetical protein F2Q70_00015492 [Brassica cretica]
MCENYPDLRERFRGTLAFYLILNGFLITQPRYQSHHRVTLDPFLLDFFIHPCIPTEFLGFSARLKQSAPIVHAAAKQLVPALEWSAATVASAAA